MSRLKKISLCISIVAIIFVSLYGIPASYGVIQGHNPLVIQGHSPIVLLVRDPSGNRIGCTASPCTSSASPNFVDTIPPSEGPATYNFTSNSISIANSSPGTWTVKYTGTGATTSTPFKITGMTCPEKNGDSNNKGHQEPGCSPTDTDDKPVTVTLLNGTVKGTQTGSVQFSLNHNDSIKHVCQDNDSASLGNALPNTPTLNQDCD